MSMDKLYAGTVKWIRVGSYWKPVADSGDEGEANIAWNTNGLYYYHGFTHAEWSSKAWFLGTENWTDTLGTNHPIWISGHGQWDVNESKIVMPVEDENGYTIRKYVRYPPPEIFVDDVPMHKPFPIDDSDEINPDKIPGTADIMLESFFRTNMGLTVSQKVLGFSQKNHDDYIIYDWTFTNTGNADLDENIEYPDQTLEDVFFLRQIRPGEVGDVYQHWLSSYGQYTTDTLRIPGYAYPARMEGASFDHFGDVDIGTGQILDPSFRGETIVQVDKSKDDTSDNLAQPHMTGATDADLPFTVRQPYGMSESDWANLYQTMEFGLLPYDGMPEIDHPDVYPGTHHSVKFDERGHKYVSDWEGFSWSSAPIYAIGPFTIEPGEDFHIIWADVVGSISYEKGWDVGKAWLGGNSEEIIPFSGEDNLPEAYHLFPDLAPTENDRNKDRWIMTGLDSLHMNANAAKWAYDQNYIVPEPPPAPSVWVWSRPEGIEIEWSYDFLHPSVIPNDLDGFRIYRATEIPDTTWELVGDVGSHVRSFKDRTNSWGVDYFYQVAAYDDGLSNPVGVKGIREVLESGRYLNRTTQPVRLTRAAGTLDDIVVVPNPFNIRAREIQYVGEQDKIMFLNIPGYCIIDIYTESGDHVRKIVHDDGSGDESWGVWEEEFSATKFYQKVISGLYLARVEEINKSTGRRTGNARVVKFLVVR